VATHYTHYAMLKTTSQLLGLTTFLGHANEARSMRLTFRL
jgi:hypothetical protein